MLELTDGGKHGANVGSKPTQVGIHLLHGTVFFQHSIELDLTAEGRSGLFDTGKVLEDGGESVYKVLSLACIASILTGLAAAA